MRAVSVAVVGNLSLDLVDGGPPRVGGPPYYASQALAALAVPATVRVKCAPADRPAFEPAFRDVTIEWLPGTTTATYAFSYDGDARTMDVRALGDRWRPDDVVGSRSTARASSAPLARDRCASSLSPTSPSCATSPC